MSKRIPHIISIVFLVVFTLVCADAVTDLWPAVGVQADVCGKLKEMSEEPGSPLSEALWRAGKIGCGDGPISVTRVNVEGMRMALSPDQALSALVLLFGGLGGAIQSLRALVLPSGDGNFDGPSIAWNVVRPFVAMAMGLCVYVLLRAVFLPAGNVATVNPYGFLAAAALVGLLTDRIVSWAVLLGRSSSS